MQETQEMQLDWEDPLEKERSPLQCSCLKNSMNRGDWWATVYGVAQSQTRLKQLTSSSSMLTLCLIFWGSGNGSPLQCSCLENPRDGGAWWAAVYRVAQSWTRLKWLSNSSSRSKVTRAPFYIPTSSSWGFQFLHIFTNTCCYCHPSGCRVVSHCGFNLQIPKANNLIISSWSS